MRSPLLKQARKLVSPIIESPNEQPVGVLDIGSNSIRLVVYERFTRALTPIFNEKASCGLGRGVAETGMIAQENAEMALDAVTHFARAVTHLEVQKVHIIATSAVREAKNGPAFMQDLLAIMDAKGQILSGAEEAHFAAMGIISAMPDFKGLVGDLGGGSLEFSQIADGVDQGGESLTLGAIRLQDDSLGEPQKAFEIAQERLKQSDVFMQSEAKTFAAIGGTWRALAKVLQNVQSYPLHMIHGYSAKRQELLELCQGIIGSDIDPKLMRNVGNTRRALLPFGAASMAAILESSEIEEVVFSALGVREGYLFAQLEESERAKDPLLQSVKLFNSVRARAPRLADELVAFCDSFVAATQIGETDKQRQLRHAACYLSDIGWRGHPDYRGEQSVSLVAFSAMAGIDHPGRAILAEILAVRYMGPRHDSISRKLMDLASEQEHEHARLTGLLFRLAYYVCGAMPGILPQAEFVISPDGQIVLKLPESAMIGRADKTQSRLKPLQQLLDRPILLELV